MVVIIKKLVPVYSKNARVSKSLKNLRKAVHVASFKHLYPNIPEILITEYGLRPNEKIIVFWTREVRKRRFPRFRLPFKRVYSGPLSRLGEYMERVRRRGRDG
jgi:hypothetical protein